MSISLHAASLSLCFLICELGVIMPTSHVVTAVSQAHLPNTSLLLQPSLGTFSGGSERWELKLAWTGGTEHNPETEHFSLKIWRTLGLQATSLPTGLSLWLQSGSPQGPSQHSGASCRGLPAGGLAGRISGSFAERFLHTELLCIVPAGESHPDRGGRSCWDPHLAQEPRKSVLPALIRGLRV